MAVTISEEVKAYFTADASSFIKGTKDTMAGMDATGKKQAIVNKFLANLRAQREKEEALSPIKALLAEQRAADARIKLSADTQAKILRQQRASSATNLSKEFRANFGANAKKKIGAHLQDTLGLSEDAAQGLVGRLGALAAPIGVAAAAGVIMFKEFQAVTREVQKNTGLMADLSDEMLRASRINTYSSSAEGADSLIAKITTTRDLIKKNKELQLAMDPYGYGTGFGGTAKTMAVKPVQAVYDFFNDSPFAKRAREQENLRLSTDILGRQQATMQREAVEGNRRQNDLVIEGLRGSSSQVRIKELEIARQKELVALEGTPGNTDANKAAIGERYDAQVGAAKELQRLQDNRFDLASKLRGIEMTGHIDEQKRVDAAQAGVNATKEELHTTSYRNEEERQGLLTQLGQQENVLSVAKADLQVAQTRFELSKQIGSTQATNLSGTAKQFQATLNTVGALKAELAALKDINGTRAQGLQISIAESENIIRQARQSELAGKTGSQIQEQMRKDREAKINLDKFDARMTRTSGGLISPAKDINGNLIGGIDPLTGQYRSALPGEGRAEQGLHGGGLEGGIVSAMFKESSAAEALRNAPSARGALDKLTGDPNHDPMARLNAAPIFPDLSQRIYGRIYPSSQETSSDLRRQMQRTKELLPGMSDGGMAGIGGKIAAAKDISSSRTLMQASVKIQADQLTAASVANTLLGKVISAIGGMGLA